MTRHDRLGQYQLDQILETIDDHELWRPWESQFLATLYQFDLGHAQLTEEQKDTVGRMWDKLQNSR